NSLGGSLLSIPKSGLLAASPTVVNRTWFGILLGRGDIFQPAVCVDGSVTGAVLATDGLGFNYTTGEFATNDALVASTILNAGGPGASLNGATTFTVPPFTAPDDPVQPDGSQNLDDGDARFNSLVYAVGGVLYAVH